MLKPKENHMPFGNVCPDCEAGEQRIPGTWGATTTCTTCGGNWYTPSISSPPARVVEDDTPTRLFGHKRDESIADHLPEDGEAQDPTAEAGQIAD